MKRSRSSSVKFDELMGLGSSSQSENKPMKRLVDDAKLVIPNALRKEGIPAAIEISSSNGRVSVCLTGVDNAQIYRTSSLVARELEALKGHHFGTNQHVCQHSVVIDSRLMAHTYQQ